MSLIEFTPDFSPAEVVELAERQFDVKVSDAKLLPGERDQNFMIVDDSGKEWVLKICNGAEDAEFLAAQHSMIRHLSVRGADVPQLRKTATGNDFGAASRHGNEHLIRVVEFLHGTPLASIRYRSSQLLFNLGSKIGLTTVALEDFSDTAFHRSFAWDLACAPDAIRKRLPLLTPDLTPVVCSCLDDFDQFVDPVSSDLPQSIIHNDANDGNVIVANDGDSVLINPQVTGLIDFGDAIFSWTVAELAIAIAYAVFHSSDPLRAARHVLRGYCTERTLSSAEIETLHCLIKLRLCLSAAMAAEQSRLRPDDQYLTVSQAPLMQVLPKLDEVPQRIATDLYRQTAGLGVSSRIQSTLSWLNSPASHASLPLKLPTEHPKLVPVDLSVSTPWLTGEPLDWTPACVGESIAQQLTAQEFGVGRYMEARLLYADEHFSNATASAADKYAVERRTVHLGVDIFAAAGTPVLAVLDGTVERVDVCPEPLDYGHLTILRHEPSDGICFYTIYGHLSPSCQSLKPGTSVSQGDVIAELGDVDTNGGWPPHIHFQLATDLLDVTQNFPGVCRASRQSAWEWTCPDPSHLLRLSEARCENVEQSRESAIKNRRRSSPSNLRLSYQSPLKIVRGWKHFLFDESGHRFLDAYNNVPHVGHCHPRVVDVLRQQSSLLNTNTRYLHDLRSEFAETLLQTFPDSLNVCVFTNSASEANELALRMARAVTNGTDVIVLEGAYHGHSSSLIDMSPYKHDGPGGTGAPDWVHTAKVADTFRGSYRSLDDAGREYAADVVQTISRLHSSGRTLCGFLAESCPSVGGQIIFPKGYLQHVYAAVRTAGALCIADEVQTGYGRLGDYFYGFEQQNVVPDIVVLGKPIGNGHPLAAVVTTAEIAARFDTGMEFFSTFGGNTVSCAVGLEVLRILQHEKLQDRAATTGQFLKRQLHELSNEFPIIGDVRGSGLFLGMELVENRATLRPCAAEASFIVERMKDQGILLGTDGPLHNVLKIRPPMTFELSDAETLVAAMRAAFRMLP